MAYRHVVSIIGGTTLGVCVDPCVGTLEQLRGLKLRYGIGRLRRSMFAEWWGNSLSELAHAHTHTYTHMHTHTHTRTYTHTTLQGHCLMSLCTGFFCYYINIFSIAVYGKAFHTQQQTVWLCLHCSHNLTFVWTQHVFRIIHFQNCLEIVQVRPSQHRQEMGSATIKFT